MNRFMACLACGMVLGIAPAVASSRMDGGGIESFLDQDLTSDSFSFIQAEIPSVFDGAAAPTVSGGGLAQLDFRSFAKPKGPVGYIASFAETSSPFEEALTDANNGMRFENGRFAGASAIRYINASIPAANFGLNSFALVGVTDAPEPSSAAGMAMGLGLMVLALSRKRRAAGGASCSVK